MEYVVTAEEMRKCDTNTIEKFHVPSLVLMERAALAVYDVINEYHQSEKKVLIVAGTGNNGADGIAVGRLLAQSGFYVTFFLVGKEEKFSEAMQAQLKIIRAYGYSVCTSYPDEEYDIIVDALFGIGLSRDVQGNCLEAIRCMNQAKGWKISVDMPSGIHTDTGAVLGEAIKADVTVTFAYRKLGQILYPGCGYAGKLIVKQIGITEEGFLGQRPQVCCFSDNETDFVPERLPYGNKGTFGKVLIVAGSDRMSGACLLSAEAAFRSGCGMVRVLTDGVNREIVATKLPEALLDAYQNEEQMLSLLQEGCAWADCILVGPGCGTADATVKKIQFLLSSTEKPLVIDADGLNVISENLTLYNLLKETIIEKNRTIILTPHLGEFSKLCKKSIPDIKADFINIVRQYAQETGCIIVCKDARTVVCRKDDFSYLNISGNSGMATAGSGDVLAGVIVGLMAQSKNGFEAAMKGVYLHGILGDRAAERKNEYTLLASDLIEMMDDVLRKNKQTKQR